LGQALTLVSKRLTTPPMPQRTGPPVLALVVSDGMHTGDWRAGLRAVDATPWGKRAVRVAIGIGEHTDKGMLKEFLANPELEPLRAENPMCPEQLVAAIRWPSEKYAVIKNDRPPPDAPPVVEPPTPGGDATDDVW
jgi:hypothetical protein